MSSDAKNGLHHFMLLARTNLAGAWDTVENCFENMSERLVNPSVKLDLNKQNLGGKVCVVTGGNAGIGFATAKLLAERGAHVIIACRDSGRGAAAAQTLRAMVPLEGCPPATVEVMPLDLSSLSSVRKFCKSFNRRGLPLDVLVCNAGLMSPPQRLESQDGLELQFQVNFLSHWLLTHTLMAEQRSRRWRCLASGWRPFRPCKAVNPDGTRVVVVSSLTHPAGQLQWEDKQSQRSYSPFLSYGLSKLANVMAGFEYHRRFERNQGLYGHDTAVVIHPGVVDTDLATGFFKDLDRRGALGPLGFVVQGAINGVLPLLLRSPDSAGRSMLLAITAPAEEVGGRYLSNRTVTHPDKVAEDEEKGQELWQLACELTGVTTHESLV